eukprot:scaffold2857_cov399-Prasinococcus_capsulatus_cf.AAC.7
MPLRTRARTALRHSSNVMAMAALNTAAAVWHGARARNAVPTAVLTRSKARSSAICKRPGPICSSTFGQACSTSCWVVVLLTAASPLSSARFTNTDHPVSRISGRAASTTFDTHSSAAFRAMVSTIKSITCRKWGCCCTNTILSCWDTVSLALRSPTRSGVVRLPTITRSHVCPRVDETGCTGVIFRGMRARADGSVLPTSYRALLFRASCFSSETSMSLAPSNCGRTASRYRESSRPGMWSIWKLVSALLGCSPSRTMTPCSRSANVSRPIASSSSSTASRMVSLDSPYLDALRASPARMMPLRCGAKS